MREVQQERDSEFVDRLVHINRVAKVVKGGKRFGFAALVVVGDQKGRVGFGHGKAREVPEAITKATASARKKMIRVPLKEGRTLHHDGTGHFGAGKVTLRSAPSGRVLLSRVRPRSRRGSTGPSFRKTSSTISQISGESPSISITAQSGKRVKARLPAGFLRKRNVNRKLGLSPATALRIAGTALGTLARSMATATVPSGSTDPATVLKLWASPTLPALTDTKATWDWSAASCQAPVASDDRSCGIDEDRIGPAELPDAGGNLIDLRV